jgi:hypothetical protein
VDRPAGTARALYNEQGLRPAEIAVKLGVSTYTATQIILAARDWADRMVPGLEPIPSGGLVGLRKGSHQRAVDRHGEPADLPDRCDAELR